jgi:hypothetical protein
MTTKLQTNAGEPAFVPVDVLETKCNIPAHIVRSNIEKSFERNLPRLHHLPQYGKHDDRPLAVVAGGPSLDKTFDELAEFDRIMVCGSAHDYLIGRGFVPTYSAVCDADISTTDFMKLPDHRCCYFIASMCHPALFDLLTGHRVVLWHSFQGDLDCFCGEPAIMGGCTITLRAINLAIVLGYKNLHFFGLDSSFVENEHCYESQPSSPVTIEARAGGKVFKTTPPWLAQATHFAEMYRNMSHLFTPTVHGDGLIAAMMNQGDYA